MAIIRTLDNGDNGLKYVGTLSFLCALSCAIMMVWFRGFKATFSISKNTQSSIVHYDESPGVSLTGAYRANRDELFGNINYPNPPKKITPDMVRLPAAQSGHRTDISKSTNNLAQPLNEKINKTKSTPNIPEVVLEPLTKKQIKEEKKLEKNLLDEQKKQAKLAAREEEKAEKLRKEKDKVEKLRKEQEKVEKLRKDRETKMQKTKAEEKEQSKRKAPQPQQTQNLQAMPEIASRSERQESTNTLENISKSSGPPPYSPKRDKLDRNRENNTSDSSTNITFADEDSSWNMVSQHRQQVSRPVVVKSLPKQTHLDLNYNVGTTNVRDNSDA